MASILSLKSSNPPNELVIHEDQRDSWVVVLLGEEGALSIAVVSIGIDVGVGNVVLLQQ